MITPQRLAEMGERVDKATMGPWSWESVGEKVNEYVVGIAFDEDENQLSGRLPSGYDERKRVWLDEEIIRKYEIGSKEAATLNYSDADFLAHSRTDIPDLLEHVKGLEEEIQSMKALTLTIDQIKDLAEFAGLKVEGEITDDDKETEIVITKCPEKGVEETDGSIVHYRHIAYLEEYPDEGVCPLGDATKTLLEKGQQ